MFLRKLFYMQMKNMLQTGRYKHFIHAIQWENSICQVEKDKIHPPSVEYENTSRDRDANLHKRRDV